MSRESTSLLSVDSERGRARIVSRGDIDAETLRADLEALLANPEYERWMDLEWNLCEAHFVGEVTGLNDFARWIESEEFGGVRSRTALVAELDHEYGLARLIATRASLAPLEVQAFRSTEDAEAWLDETPPPLRPR